MKECLQVARLCRERGLGFTAHSWSTGIGYIVNAHVTAASGFASELPFEYPLSPPGWTVEARDAVLAEPWAHERGWFPMPQRPGLGFEIDHDALARLGRCFFRADRVTRVWTPEVLSQVNWKAPRAEVTR